VHVGLELDKSAPTHSLEGTEIGVMDNLQVPELEINHKHREVGNDPVETS
jgi:hypothetical protein